MSPGLKLAAYGAVLVAVLGGGAAVGGAVGPVDTGTDDPPAHEEQHTPGADDEAPEASEAPHPDSHADADAGTEAGTEAGSPDTGEPGSGGDTAVVPPAEPDRTAAVDGYEVTLTGDPVAGSEAEVELTVTRDGEPVTDLSPYLGAFGHLVAIRGSDLAYLHVHPLGDEVQDDHATGGPGVRFAVPVATAGDYRLFFDFAHGGDVHTAAFTIDVPDGGAS